MADFHRADALTGCGHVAAQQLWRMTDFVPADVDVAQIYDAFSPLILFSLEAYGFVQKGEAARFICDGALRPMARCRPTRRAAACRKPISTGSIS